MQRESTDRSERLLALSNIKEYRVAKGESDIRGWDVVTRDHKRIGEVHELIVDPAAMKVRYLDIALDKNLLETRDRTHILVPIAGATLDDDDNRVYVDNVSMSQIESMPPYDHRPITRDYENLLMNVFQGGDQSGTSPTVAEGADDDFYRRPQFEDRQFWGRRRAGREDSAYLDRHDGPDDRGPDPDDRRIEDSLRRR
jgi:photosynthetic reaction center H subunit